MGIGFGCLLDKIVELLSPGARVNALAEDVVMHVQSIRSDLISHPLHVIPRRPQRAIPGDGNGNGGATENSVSNGD